MQTITNSECTIPFGQTAVTEKNGTDGEHCADGRRRDLRAKRNLRLARVGSNGTRPTAGTRLASNTLRALASRRFRLAFLPLQANTCLAGCCPHLRFPQTHFRPNGMVHWLHARAVFNVTRCSDSAVIDDKQTMHQGSCQRLTG